MTERPIDFYIKGLPLDVRLEIFARLDKINPAKVEKLLEKPTGYITFRKMGLTDEGIARQIAITQERLCYVNAYMTENGRCPLFSDPMDTYQSSIEYTHFMNKRTPEELWQEFGCTWEDYVPKKYIPEEAEKDARGE